MTEGMGTTDIADASRIINDFKAQVESFPVTDFDWAKYVTRYSSETGGQVEITYRNHSSGFIPEVAEGEEPQFSHAELSKMLVDVKKYALKPAITKEMIEDSRFDELREALEHAAIRLKNTFIDAWFTAVRDGVYSATDVPDAYGNRTWTVAADHQYTADHDGVAVQQSQPGHNYNTGNTSLFLGDVHLLQRHIREHGFSPKDLLVSEEVFQKMQDLAAFTAVSVAPAPVDDLQVLGEIRGTLGGLRVIVSPWVALDEMICIDGDAKPIAYVERRAPVMDMHETDFDIVIRSLSTRFGMKMKWAGAACIAHLSA